MAGLFSCSGRSKYEHYVKSNTKLKTKKRGEKKARIVSDMQREGQKERSMV